MCRHALRVRQAAALKSASSFRSPHFWHRFVSLQFRHTRSVASPFFVEGGGGLPALADIALPRMTILFVLAYTFLTHAARILALPLASRVTAWLFAFPALAAWLLDDVLCSDLLLVCRLSSPYSEQQVSPHVFPALERRQGKGAKYQQALSTFHARHCDVTCQGVVARSNRDICDGSLKL